jgi:plastocyanin
MIDASLTENAERGYQMRRLRVLGVGVLAAVAISAFAGATPAGGSDNDLASFLSFFTASIAMRDDCDPSDPAWEEVGGCALRRGDVSVEEFDEELVSPLADSVVGHQAWRNDPSYLKVKEGRTVRVRNRGGRPHTFTEVAEFGGGFVDELNFGLDLAPECAPPAGPQGVVPPGGRTTVSGLAVGNHRFMCCIHPWMRALIKVVPKNDH